MSFNSSDDTFTINEFQFLNATDYNLGSPGLQQNENTHFCGQIVDKPEIKKRTKRIMSSETRRRHNLISKRGRQKINEEISKLKNLLPECRDVECNRAAILSCAVKNLENYQSYSNMLSQHAQKLDNDNKTLWRVCQQMALEISQATKTPYHEVMKTYNVEAPYSRSSFEQAKKELSFLESDNFQDFSPKHDSSQDENKNFWNIAY